MKDYFRKRFALLLAVMTTLSGMQFTAYAEEPDSQTDDTDIEIVDEASSSETEVTEDYAESEELNSEEVIYVENIDEIQPVEKEEEEETEQAVVAEPEPEVIGSIYTAGSAAEFAGAVSQISDDSRNRVMVATDTDLAAVLSDVEFTAVVYEGIYIVDFDIVFKK